MSMIQEFNSGAALQAGPDQGTEQLDDMLLFFADGSCALSDSEAQVLRKWVLRWWVAPGKKAVQLGGAAETPRAGRLRRLNTLLVELEQLGIPSHLVKAEGDWFRSTRMGSSDDLPCDVVWLRTSKTRPH